MSRTVLMVMLDSLRHDYVRAEDAPFLHDLAAQGTHGSLAPSFGFEPDGAYFAGLSPQECDGGAQFWLRPDERLFRLTPLFGALHRLPVPAWRRFVRKATRATAQLLARDPLPRSMASPAFIPYDQLSRFSLSLSHMPDDPRAMHGASLFDIARGRGMQTYVHCFPQFKVKTDVVRERYLAEDRGQHDFAFLFFGDLDGIGHRDGPDSPARRATLARIDAALADIWRHASSHYDDVVMVVFGDHGMAEVRGLVDVSGAIAAAGLDVRNDAWFIDSTFARFWVPDATRRERLRGALAQVPGGRLLTDADRDAWQIRWPHNYFGDEIFAVDDHLLLHPSFYAEDAPPRGMHGYLPGCRDNESAFLIAGAGVPKLAPRERADMRRMFHTVAALLGESASPPPGLGSLLA